VIVELIEKFTATIGESARWHAKEQSVYWIDVKNPVIFRHNQYNKKTNEVGAREVFINFPESQGYPDGLCMDEHDHLWVAGWGKYHIYNYSPNGQLVKKIAFPAKNITSCALDADKNRLFVTSANFELVDREGVGDKAGKMFVCSNIYGA
jgi:sugar lactone lactonase YvrE